jgi:hypothetical protein
LYAFVTSTMLVSPCVILLDFVISNVWWKEGL